MISTLRRTHTTAQTILRLVAPHLPPPPNNPAAPTLTHGSDLGLVVPALLTTRLTQSGVEPSTAQRISLALSRVTGRLRESCEEDHTRRRQALLAQESSLARDPRLPSVVSSAYVTLYNKTVRDWTTHILQDVVPRVLRLQAEASRKRSQRSFSNPRKRPFNQSAVPILDKFFDQNPFPSRLEKYELASRCDMEYRQIHVWFQNRRSRLRKEGRELKQPAPQSPLLDELEKTVIDALLPDECSDGDENIQGSSLSVEGETRETTVLPLPLDPPPHAFPAPYPPICSYEPFPMEKEQRAFMLPWIRQRSPPQALDEAHLSMSTLVERFAQLSLKGGSGADDAPHVTAARRPDCYNGLLAFVTPCVRAPHPALVPRCTNQLRRFPSSRCTSSFLRTPAMSTGAASPVVIPQTRPRRTLPQRLPKHRPISFSYVETTDPLAMWLRPKPTSRTASVTSLSSSSGSSASDPDSPLPTPPFLHLSLPTSPPSSGCGVLPLDVQPSALTADPSPWWKDFW